MTQQRASTNRDALRETVSAVGKNYYVLLGLHPSASAIEIRRAYRELSKRYHPDTTELPHAVATSKFQQLNEAYATLSNPERRAAYDLQIRYSRLRVVQPSRDLDRPATKYNSRPSSAYLDPVDRPLSAGEVFSLFLLCASLGGSLFLAIAIALLRGDPL
ncbi:J domain-containing protein [Baaleninema sp.]|uniref:J domain-containing protein n=1 Tax=Baaleninema sp. TaxID=3101197 RepID=UPI003D00685A